MTIKNFINTILCIVPLLSSSLLAQTKEPKQKPPVVKKEKQQPPTRLYNAPGSPDFTVVADAKLTQTQLLDKEGNFVVGPKFTSAPESKKVAGVPEGKLEQFVLDSTEGTIYNPGIARKVFGTVDPNNPKTLIVETHNIDYKRTITVYIPAGYVPGTEMPFMVTHDGPKGKPDKGLATILDNLIAQKRIPAMIVINIANGGGDAQGHQRGKEYDTMSGLFAEYIETHVLPVVESKYSIKLTKDPDGRATMGNSSGASAALIMAWYRTDLYHRVISFSGTFVNQQWPFNPETPDGAWGFHNKIIPESEVKPIRIWMGVGDRDNYNPNVMRDDMHDWVEANNRMAKVLKDKGYHYQYFFCLDNGHGMNQAKSEYMPHAIEWIWRDYKEAE
jgi:iron(III)-enterobactin esterase